MFLAIFADMVAPHDPHAIALPDLVILITLPGIVRRIPDANMSMALLVAIAFLRIAPATRQPGLAIWPGVAIALSVFGFNMFGDALRDILDPRLRGRR